VQFKLFLLFHKHFIRVSVWTVQKKKIIMWMKLALKVATKVIIYIILWVIVIQYTSRQRIISPSVQFSFSYLFSSIPSLPLWFARFYVSCEPKKRVFMNSNDNNNKSSHFMYIAQCNVCDYCGQEHDTISASLFIFFTPILNKMFQICQLFLACCALF